MVLNVIFSTSSAQGCNGGVCTLTLLMERTLPVVMILWSKVHGCVHENPRWEVNYNSQGVFLPRIIQLPSLICATNNTWSLKITLCFAAVNLQFSSSTYGYKVFGTSCALREYVVFFLSQYLMLHKVLKTHVIKNQETKNQNCEDPFFLCIVHFRWQTDSFSISTGIKMIILVLAWL